MISALVVSNVLLWLIVLGLGVTVVALTRQLGLLHERVAPVGALSQSPKVKVGAKAPEMVLRDIRDRVVEIGRAAGDDARTLLFFLSPTCPVCKRAR